MILDSKPKHLRILKLSEKFAVLLKKEFSRHYGVQQTLWCAVSSFGMPLTSAPGISFDIGGNYVLDQEAS